MKNEVLRDILRLGVQTIISLFMVGSGMYVLFTVDPTEQRELVLASAGWIGAVLGYWMR